MEMTSQWTAKDKAKFYAKLYAACPSKSDRDTLRTIFNLCAEIQKKVAGLIEYQEFCNLNRDYAPRFDTVTECIDLHFQRPASLTGFGDIKTWDELSKRRFPNLPAQKTASDAFGYLATYYKDLTSDILEHGDDRMDFYSERTQEIADQLNNISELCNTLSKRMNKRLGTMVRNDRSLFIPFMD